MTKRNIIETVIAIGVLIGMIFGGMNYFAKAADVEKLNIRLEQKIVNDQIFDTYRIINQLEDFSIFS